MAPTVGFVLLTHNKPQMTGRLIAKLCSMFDAPPIACHHDFSKCDLPVESLPANVSFVRPHVETSWASFTEVEATARAIRLLYESQSAPDWFIYLSGADYPIKPAAQILRDLRASESDAHINAELIERGRFTHPWHGLCYHRYCTKRLTPFSPRFKCYAGGQWFCANARAAEYIVEFHATQTALADHYRDLQFASESYFQCVLANAPHLRLSEQTWRYTDWSAGGAHPKTLGMEDLPTLLASHAHFARKFDADTDARVLDELDARTS
ncbi:MAG TPA: beta-1,6-N-acetylglucosaminyltransferase [Pyrinomonadaceae bacterium]|nr:beta-1,6-N-acetylglucosaminyltransferase [Pyrinomonadaceae bacterium]